MTLADPPPSMEFSIMDFFFNPSLNKLDLLLYLLLNILFYFRQQIILIIKTNTRRKDWVCRECREVVVISCEWKFVTIEVWIMEIVIKENKKSCPAPRAVTRKSFEISRHYNSTVIVACPSYQISGSYSLVN